MVKSLIDLSEFTYEDYMEISSYIDESFIVESKEEKEVDKLLSKLKTINSKLDKKDIDKDTVEDMQNVLEDLNSVASDIRSSKIGVFKTLVVITTVITFIEKILNIINTIKNIKKSIQDAKINGGDNVTLSFKDNLSQLIGGLLFSGKQAIFDFFKLKNLLSLALSTINKIVAKKSSEALVYEKTIDKTYEMLLKVQAKAMIEKRKAEKDNDTYSIECCDKVIEYVEEMKKERVKQRMSSSTNESVVLEYKGNEFKVTMFKLAMDEIKKALDTEIKNLKVYCNASKFIVRTSISMNNKNKYKKLSEIEKKVEEVDKDIEDKTYDKTTISSILQKYSNMFSNKYSEYGMAAREEFEKKLISYKKEIVSTIEDYEKEISNIVFDDNNDHPIDRSIDTLEKLIEDKTDYSSSKLVKRFLSNLDDDSKLTLDFCNEFIKWCRSNIKAKEIKDSISYKLINSILK